MLKTKKIDLNIEKIFKNIISKYVKIFLLYNIFLNLLHHYLKNNKYETRK